MAIKLHVGVRFAAGTDKAKLPGTRMVKPQPNQTLSCVGNCNAAQSSAGVVVGFEGECGKCVEAP